ncbi:MAG: phosphate acyltransferase PlsX [Pseudomonadota bacterium]|nr:phosphate acyltransferase PlsX [Pseudomonadota bacterium]
MPTSAVVALDAMGGDHAPEIVFAGAALARERFPRVKFLFFGDEGKVKPILDRYPALHPVSELRHAPDAIGADTKPSIALRQSRQSSMRLAINAVAEGEAGSVVSAGNTGALLAIAKFVLRTLPGIDRPALASLIPTTSGESVMLDLGVNVECDAENLVQFALMGGIFCSVVLGISNPTIGLLNVGTEEVKGHDEVRTAATMLRERSLGGTFHGFVEGNDIALGTVDVVVTDGFSGNIALKTLEGTAQLITWFMRQSFASSPMAKLGYFFARGAMHKLKLRADPRRYNGAMLLGLQGICVKSHGGADREGFATAVGVACDLMERNYNARITEQVALQYGLLSNPATEQAV